MQQKGNPNLLKGGEHVDPNPSQPQLQTLGKT